MRRAAVAWVSLAVSLWVASCGSSGSSGGGGNDGGSATDGEGSPVDGSGSSSGSAASSSGTTSSGSTGSGSSSSGGTASSSSSGASSSSSSGSPSGDAGEPACTASSAVCTTNDTGCNVGPYYLYDNQWNCNPAPSGVTCGAESAYGCTNPDGTVAFVVTSNQPAGNTAVLTYPSMQDNFGANPTLASFHAITATFDEASPHVGDYEVAWDCWFNGQKNELMIWVDDYQQTPGGTKVATGVSLSGRTWDVYQSGTQAQGYLAYVAQTSFTSGTVDLLAIFQHAVAQGYLPPAATTTVGQLSFGVEVCSTNGQTATWTIAKYGMTAN